MQNKIKQKYKATIIYTIFLSVLLSLNAFAAKPAINLDSWGAVNYGGSTWAGLSLGTKVIDHDGVSSDGSTHTVTVTDPNGTVYQVDYYKTRSSTEAEFNKWVDYGSSNPPSGDYTFKVVDPDGNEATGVDTLNVNPLSPPDESSLKPSNYNPVQEYITAYFDNVYVNGSLYDDFNSGTIDTTTKWNTSYNGGGSEPTIDGNRLKCPISDAVGRGNSGLGFKDPSTINSIKADITINSVSSNGPPRARIGGNFCSNGTNDIHAKINIYGNRVSYGVTEEWIDTSHNTWQWSILASGDLMTVTVGTTVSAEISWDGTAFTFNANGNTATYSPGGTLTAPTDNVKYIRARIHLNTDTTPTFEWSPVTNANQYRVRIYNYDSSKTIYNLYFSNQVSSVSQTSMTVPPGILNPNSYYRYRIEARDAHSPLDVDNNYRSPNSSNDYYVFYTGDESVDPFIEFHGAGVETWQIEGYSPWLSIWTRVHDAQGVPGDISSVKVISPSGAEEVLDYDSYSSYNTSTAGIYRKRTSSLSIESGTYTFRVEDKSGNVYTVTEDLTNNPIGYPASSTLSPSSNTVVSGTAVDFDWADVSGAAFYAVRIFDSNFSRIYQFYTTQSQYSLPAGFLEENKIYYYRIITRREFFSQNVDNGSSSPFGGTIHANRIITTSDTSGKTSVADSNVTISQSVASSEFQMVSFVQYPDDPLSTNVFSSAMGGSYDTDNFKIGSYSPSSGSYTECGSSLNVKPGRAYWFGARNGCTITVNGVAVSTSLDIDIRLKYDSDTGNGWNMIGPPNGANYYWDNVQVVVRDSHGNMLYGPTAISDLPDPNDYIDKRLWRYSGGTYYSDTSLMEKYKGYWVKAKTKHVFLRYPASRQVAKLSNYTIMIARLNGAKRWLKQWVFTSTEAIANSGDYPPDPIGSLSSGSTASASGGGGGCFIATAAFGSPLMPHVQILQKFRDRILMPYVPGKMFVKAYYTSSPAIADFISKHDTLKVLVRLSLLPFVGAAVIALTAGPAYILIFTAIFAALLGCAVLFQKRSCNFKNIAPSGHKKEIPIQSS